MRRAAVFYREVREFCPCLRHVAPLCALVFLCLGFSACGIGSGGGNSCITFIWNPGGINNPENPVCPGTEANGTVSVQIFSRFAAASSPTSPNLEHLYVTLQGIDGRPSATPDESSSGWEELAPELAEHPAQLDLLARAGESCATHLVAQRRIPADVYTAIRLRIAADGTVEGVAAPEQNACGTVGLNCVVTTRGDVRPLLLDGATPDLLIGPDQLAGGFLRILPDQENNVSIEFNPYSSLAKANGESVEVVPDFTATSEAPCSSPQPEDNSTN